MKGALGLPRYLGLRQDKKPTYVTLPRQETGARSAMLALALARGETIERSIDKLPVSLVTGASG